MNLHELDRYKLSDAVKFNARLNPKLWGKDEHLKPEVREALMKIADDFRESLGVKDLDLKDITLSGSNAAYTYTPNSDIDLHLVVRMPNDPVYRELFDAKKYAYNNQHNIKIGGYDVELYVQDEDQPHVTQGEYSLINNDWIQVPRRQRADVVDQSTRSKYQDLKQRIKAAIKSGDHATLAGLMSKIKQLRQSGLDKHGEFGPENLAFKMLRTQGYIQKLADARNAAKDQELSIDERVQPRVTYGFTTESKDNLQDTINQFAQSCIEYLGIKKAPEIRLHTNTDWSEQTGSFGQYEPETNVLHLATSGRHTLDILRTMAHEFTHRKQAEKETLPDNAGETGSPYEDEANAMAGRIMRHWAEKHPEMFSHVPLEEASGYIPTKKQARDPRFVMALTKDVRPGAVGKEANKLGLQTDSQGHPALLTATLNESLLAELALFKEQDLFEINMGGKNLRREAAKTGAIAGMEFEMIVPNVEGGDSDMDQEANYDMDEGCRSIQDAYDFFYDGDWNSRRSCNEMRDKMREDYIEWLDEKIADDWERGGDDYITDWVKNNVDESEWNPDDLEGDARNEALEEYAANVHADPVSRDYQSAYEEFREENQESYDESDWLDDANLSSMSDIENAYSMTWPHWSDPQGGGEAEISDVAADFENAIGRDVRASDNYHSGSTIRPSPTQIRYVVEPDGSLEPDNSGDRGLEFVSPPLPIDEILSDLNKVKKWAKEYGCYTNDSTGLHINISVPNYSRENLDFVKLALLMGDKYVLDAFGRAGNTYAKSAFDIVKRIVRDQPEEAAKLLDKMKGNLDQLATKAIHSGATSKYTSINVKDGHIEFRSPGGDWLDENFDQIENTLLRFTVAMSAALDPEMYRQEYLTKLYKLLSENNKGDDTIKYFADYVAGKIPKAALRSFVKQAQLQRNVRRGKTDGRKMWWKVYKYGNSAGRFSPTIEVVATSEKEAKQKAAKEWGEPITAAVLSQFDAEALRIYDENTGSGTYELYKISSGNTIPDTEFSARNSEEVQTRLSDYINHGRHGMSQDRARLMIGARRVAAPADTPALNGRPSNPNGNYVIIDQARPTRPVYRYMAADANDGLLVLQQWITANPGTTSWTFKYDPNQELGQPSAPQTGTGAYELFDRRTGEAVPDSEFTARNQADVNTRLDDYINFGPHGVGSVDARLVFGVRPVADADQETLSNSLRPTGPGPWEIYNRATGNSAANLSVDGRPITDRAQAQRMAMGSIAAGQHDNYGVRTRGTLSGTNIGTQTDMENRLGMPSQSEDANYAVVDRQTLDPVFRFRAADRTQANRIYGYWLAAAGLPQTTEDYGFQEIRPESVAQRPSEIARDWRIVDRATDETLNTVRGASQDQALAVRADTARRHGVDASQLSLQVIFNPNATQQGIPEVPLDIEQNFPDRTDGRDINFGNQFSGQWRVVDVQGREVYRFRGVGNSQDDANRIASLWAIENNYRGNLEVLPVMTESVQESLNEIEQISQQFFTGGKDELERYKTPSKKQLRPLPGGTDLMYSISNNSHGSYVTIVDPGMPGITRPTVVASLSLVPGVLPDSVQVGMITVDEDYRGRGLAKALYGIVLTIMKKTLISGSSQTPGGRRNWLSLASIPGVEVKGLVALSNRDTDTTVGDPKSRYNKYVEKTIDRVMELGGQFISRDKYDNYWAFDVVPGKGQLQPAVRNALSKLYGYDSDALLMAKWTGA
jgi:Putative amidoligase enzyme